MSAARSWTGSTSGERARARRYMRDLGIGIAAYAIVLIASRLLLKAGVEGMALRAAVSLAPMLPVLFTARVIIRHLNQLDELQRRIQVEALAFSVLGTAIVTMGWGFLENVGAPDFPIFFVWPLMAVIWLIAGIWIGRRYAD